MFQRTIKRFDNIITNKIIIICNNQHKLLVKDQIDEINKSCTILVEPISKNTAPAITLASLYTKPDEVLLILPSDHFIEEETVFLELLTNSVFEALNNKIVIYGIHPTGPNTNYGYIETRKNNECFDIISFRENLT